MAMQQLSPSHLDRRVRQVGDLLGGVFTKKPDSVTETTAEALALASQRKSLAEDRKDALQFAHIVTGALAVGVGFVASRVSSLAAAAGVLACMRAGQVAKEHIRKIYDRQIERLNGLGG